MQNFLLHIIDPDKFPIFYQHVYRAYNFLVNRSIKEISDSNKAKLICYDQYSKFFNKLKSESNDPRKIDKALWAFGKFLKTGYVKRIITDETH